MNDAAGIFKFSNREEYRDWLKNHYKQETGIWIIFTKGSKQFTANDALEESICFGWIDGLMKSIDEKNYKKYFSKRKNADKWSEKNISLYMKLLHNGFITEPGTEIFKAEDNKKNR